MYNTAFKYASDSLSCLMIRIDGELRRKVKALAASIPSDLLIEAETDPHITLLYGIEEDQKRFARDLLRLWGRPIPFLLDSVSVFESDEYDVVKVDVYGFGIHVVHNLLKSHLSVTETYPTYIPHVTLGYVKKGEGRSIAAKMAGFKGFGSADEVIFSDADRTHSVIRLVKETAKYKQEGDGSLKAAFNSEFGRLADRLHSEKGVADVDDFKKIDHFGYAVKATKGDVEAATDRLTNLLYGEKGVGQLEANHKPNGTLNDRFRFLIRFNPKDRERRKQQTAGVSVGSADFDTHTPVAKEDTETEALTNLTVAEQKAAEEPVFSDNTDFTERHRNHFLNLLSGQSGGVRYQDLLNRFRNEDRLNTLIRTTGAKVEAYPATGRGRPEWRVFHPEVEPEPNPVLEDWKKTFAEREAGDSLRQIAERRQSSKQLMDVRLRTIAKILKKKSAIMGQKVTKYAADEAATKVRPVADSNAVTQNIRLSAKAAVVAKWLKERRETQKVSVTPVTSSNIHDLPTESRQPLNNPQKPQNRVDEDLITFRQEVRGRNAWGPNMGNPPKQKSPEEYTLLTDHAVRRGLKLAKSDDGTHNYDEGTHTFFHPDPTNKAEVGEAYSQHGMGNVKYEAEKEPEPVVTAHHPLVAGFHIAHALQSIVDHPESSSDAKRLAAQVLYHGDTSALWPLNDELQDTNHPILKAGYNWEKAANALHLDRATNEVINVLGRRIYSNMSQWATTPFPNLGTEAGSINNRRRITHSSRGVAIDWIQSALFGRSKSGPALEAVDLLRKAGHSDDQLKASVDRHLMRLNGQVGMEGGSLYADDLDRLSQEPPAYHNDPARYPYKQADGVVRYAEEDPFTYPDQTKTSSLTQKPQNLKQKLMVALAAMRAKNRQAKVEVAKPDEAYDTANRKPKNIADLYGAGEEPEKYSQSPALSEFIAAVRNLRSSNQEVRRTVTEKQLKALKLDVQSLMDAVADAPHTATAGAGAAVLHDGDRDRVNAAAALLGIQMQYPSLLVFHQHDGGSDVLAKFDVVGSAEKLRKRLDSAGLLNRTLIPTENGWSATFFDRGGDMLPLIQKAAAAEGSQLQVSYGTGEVLGSGEGAEASKSDRRTYRSLIRQWEKKQNAVVQSGNPHSPGFGASAGAPVAAAAPTAAGPTATSPTAGAGFTAGQPSGTIP